MRVTRPGIDDGPRNGVASGAADRRTAAGPRPTCGSRATGARSARHEADETLRRIQHRVEPLEPPQSCRPASPSRCPGDRAGRSRLARSTPCGSRGAGPELAEPPQVRREEAELGQALHHAPPRVPGLRKAVQRDERRPVRVTGLGHVDARAEFVVAVNHTATVVDLPVADAGTQLCMRVAVVVVLLLVLAGPASARERAPGGARRKANWAPADKQGFGTSATRASPGLVHAARRRDERGLLPGPLATRPRAS